jgi:hypothetical protein
MTSLQLAMLSVPFLAMHEDSGFFKLLFDLQSEWKEKEKELKMD